MESCGCATFVFWAIKIMAAVLFLFLHFLTASALESTSDKESLLKYPHLTRCVSTNMETFYCRWDVGTFQNLSNPEDVRLFYISKLAWDAPSKEWSECPHYSLERFNECYFNENHTLIWTEYRVQLRSRDQTILYDEKHFNVQDIVQPDPPLDLNWTILNVSLTGSFYDVMLSWKPPPSADVKMGWMTLQYEVQYRKEDSEHWDTTELVKSTHRSLYGFQSNVNYEVRVRCKKHGEKRFGEFSDSIFVHVPSEASRFPLMASVIFGTFCLMATLMLVILLKQEKLMDIVLPPVPGPKIRGIDPELLKNGKLKEFTSILGSPPDLRPELCTNDPWVEFIDLDFEEQSDRITNMYTDFLMDRSLFSNLSHLSIGFRDDDSGRASCCDPDLASDPETSHFHSLITNQIRHKEPADATSAGPRSPSPSTTAGEPPSVVSVKEALYTHVSEVKPSGKVLLSPEDEMEENTLKDSKEIKTSEKNLLVNTDDRGYTSELNAGTMSQSLLTCNVRDSFSTGEDLSSIPCSSLEDYHQSSHESVINPLSHFSPTFVYTVVEDVDRQNSLVLTTNSIPSLQLTVSKDLPTPEGYLTPDLLESITPLT